MAVLAVNNVIDFPAKKTCFLCLHYEENYCQLFDQTIHSEIQAAKDCPGYEVAD